MDNQNAYTLSESDVKQISSNHIHGVDKLNRMFAGIASELERYENGIIYLKIENTEKHLPSNYKTALQFVECWIGGNKELRQAKGFVVVFYKTQSTGFAISLKDMKNNKELVNNLTQEFISANKQKEHELVNIFSGLFTNK
jgi:hypothetical protein